VAEASPSWLLRWRLLRNRLALSRMRTDKVPVMVMVGRQAQAVASAGEGHWGGGEESFKGCAEGAEDCKD